MQTIKMTRSQASAVVVYVLDPAIVAYQRDIEDRNPSFEMRGLTLHILVDADTACSELIEASNSADVDGPGAGGPALMNLCRKIRQACKPADATVSLPSD